MAWSTSRRRSTLPLGWARIRARVLRRDAYRCQWGSTVSDGAQPGTCHLRATDVDHVGDAQDHGEYNLRSLCSAHHRLRSSRQGAHASGQARAQRAALRRRPAERHPGLIE